MSRMNCTDYMDQNVEDFGLTDDPLSQLKKDLDDIDFPSNLNLENTGLMSSEFFDSVLSMEQTAFGNELDNEPLSSGMESDITFSDADDMRFANNCSPESGSSSMDYEFKDFGVEYSNDNDLVLNFINPTEETNIKNNTQTIQVPTKVFISNPNGKKVILTKPYANKNNKRNITNTKQVLRVQSISGGGRSVLLPFNVTKMKNIKIINGKELQAENLKITKITDLPQPRKPCVTTVRKAYIDNYEASSPETFDDDSDSVDAKSDQDRQYPALILTDEEKRLLNKEGICLPTHYPLTKQQERELKRIRRKIRNKISAQDSRKRKKEYVDGLEERIKQGAEEKKILMNRVKHLQQQNSRLIAQMNKLQALVFNTSGSKATPTTCLLIVLVSALLVSLPNLRVPQNSSEWKYQQQSIARRALLSSQQATNEDTINMEEFLLFNKEDESELKSSMFDEDNNTEDFGASKFIHKFDKYDSSDQNNPVKDNMKKSFDSHELDKEVRNTYAKVRNFFQEEFNNVRYDYDSFGKIATQYQPKKKFIEPDIDDDGPDIGECPPTKKMKMVDANDNIIFNDCVPKTATVTNVVSATVSVNSSKKE